MFAYPVRACGSVPACRSRSMGILPRKTSALLAMQRAVRDGQTATIAAHSRPEIDVVIQRMLGVVARHSGARYAYVCEYRNGRRRLFNTHEWRESESGWHPDLDLDPGTVLEWTRAMTGRETRQPRSGADPTSDRVPQSRLLMDRGARPLLVLPLRSGSELIGFVCIGFGTGATLPSAEGQEVLAALSDTIALAISRGRENS